MNSCFIHGRLTKCKIKCFQDIAALYSILHEKFDANCLNRFFQKADCTQIRIIVLKTNKELISQYDDQNTDILKTIVPT